MPKAKKQSSEMTLDDKVKIVGEMLGEVLTKSNSPKANDSNPDTNKKCSRGQRSFIAVTYIDPLKVRDFLLKSSWVQHWAMCTHDSDVWSSDDEKENPNHKANTAKEIHTHIVLYTFDTKTSSAVEKLFKRFSVSVYGAEKSQNTRVDYCGDMSVQYRYLLHKDDPQKHQYNPLCLYTDNTDYWQKYECGKVDKPNSALSMVQDVIDGVPYRVMCEKYGKDFVYHRRYVEEMANRIRYEEDRDMHIVDEEMVKMVLNASPFYQIDIDKFFQILNYLKGTFAKDFNNRSGFEIYLDGGN